NTWPRPTKAALNACWCEFESPLHRFQRRPLKGAALAVQQSRPGGALGAGTSPQSMNLEQPHGRT
ncbi:MAG: hypothetical protein Q7U58_04175, partial [Hydrogenophaga sp.]|nr:hypothetical protein [Hydrogenophaga sp.]